MHLANGFQQLEVLHVAGADLHDVDVFFKLVDVGLIHQLADDGQAGGLTGLHQVEDALGAQALEGIGAGAGLVSAAAQEVSTAGLDQPGHFEGVLLALYAAGAGHHGDGGLAANLDAVHVHHGIIGVEQAVGALVGGGHTGHILDPGVGQHVLLGDFGGIAHQAKDVVVGTADQRDRQALMLEVIDNAVQFSLGSTFFGGNDHLGTSF